MVLPMRSSQHPIYNFPDVFPLLREILSCHIEFLEGILMYISILDSSFYVNISFIPSDASVFGMCRVTIRELDILICVTAFGYQSYIWFYVAWLYIFLV